MIVCDENRFTYDYKDICRDVLALSLGKERDLRLCYYVCKGYSNSQIAEKMNYSVTYVSQLLIKIVRKHVAWMFNNTAIVSNENIKITKTLLSIGKLRKQNGKYRIRKCN